MGTTKQEERLETGIFTEEIREHLPKNRINHMKYLPNMEIIESDVMDHVISARKIYDYEAYGAEKVRQALRKERLSPDDFKALLSPAALPFIEEMAQVAQARTREHYGNSVYMFTPLYISNYCENYCIYCGFNCHNKIKRAKLNVE